MKTKPDLLGWEGMKIRIRVRAAQATSPHVEPAQAVKPPLVETIPTSPVPNTMPVA